MESPLPSPPPPPPPPSLPSSPPPAHPSVLALPPSGELIILALGRRKQRLLIALSILPVVFLSFLLSSDPLLTLASPFRCAHPGPKLLNSTRRVQDLPQCKQFVFVNGSVSGLKECDAGFNFTVTEGLSNNIVTEWDLVCSRYWLVPVEEVCFILGTLSGSLAFGFMADRLGRQRSLLISLTLAVVFGVLVCVSPSPSIFISMRFFFSGFVSFSGELLLLALALVCSSWRGLMGIGAAPLTLFLCYGFISHGISHCYSSFSDDVRGSPPSFYWTFLLSVCAGGGAWLLLWGTVDRFGRRGILLLSMTMTGLASLILLGLMDYLSDGAMKVFSIMGLFSSQAAASLSILFSAEVMPTIIRGSGVGCVLALGCVGRLSSPLMDLRNHYGYFLHHVVYSSLALLAVLSILLLPESKRKPLPQTLADGEQYRRPPLVRHRRDNVPLLATPNPDT
ncbi:hypothetical protein DNTS_024113 [Danionella cerebrum]|uniref:Major facilitator superfamily (MFS) profile domain-containing protein n=1 Tax=Danionella cerebrum TaxID=2873325 RepID=A0A553QPJ4_9TELE|nr:hypothetical protein DNTS_024113 [Danionella translucida]